MGAAPNVVTLLQSEWGWLITLAAFLYELFWPLWDTKIQKVFHGIEGQIDDVYDEVQSLDDKQLSHIQVTRAMARTDPNIDDDRVDDYLVKNGVNPDEFIMGVRTDGGEEMDEMEDDD